MKNVVAEHDAALLLYLGAVWFEFMFSAKCIAAEKPRIIQSLLTIQNRSPLKLEYLLKFIRPCIIVVVEE
jgi:hypothetical protein